ncbi:MAG: hypothetical protein LBS04_05170 [Tannerellaceae bacterium]|jgi:hypothetical protein|nr:hypothetical protein [Tannerellaceae bacterium]
MYYHSLLAAKLGKIAWSMGEWIEAEKLLKGAADQLPGMNRLPLYYKEHLLNEENNYSNTPDTMGFYLKQRVKYLYFSGTLLLHQYISLKDYNEYIKIDFCKKNIQKEESEKSIK